MKSKSVWKRLSSKVVHVNPWYQVAHDKVLRPDGQKGDYFVVKTRGVAVFVVAIDSKKRVCLIHLHRYPTQMLSCEIPAGNSEGQNPLAAAKRELREETGYLASRWQRVAVWQSMNGVCGELSHIFIAQNLKKIEIPDRDHEGIQKVEFVPYKKALQWIMSGKISDGQSIVSLFLAGRKLGWIKFC